jgi:stress-induced morphogen
MHAGKGQAQHRGSSTASFCDGPSTLESDTTRNREKATNLLRNRQTDIHFIPPTFSWFSSCLHGFLMLRYNVPKLGKKVFSFLLTKSMSGEASGSQRGPVYNSIIQALEEGLRPTKISLIDDSAKHAGHAGMRGKAAVESHFKLSVVSDKFQGLSRVQRHQLVYGLLDTQFKSGLHALNIQAFTPTEESTKEAERKPSS